MESPHRHLEHQHPHSTRVQPVAAAPGFTLAHAARRLVPFGRDVIALLVFLLSIEASSCSGNVALLRDLASQDRDLGDLDGAIELYRRAIGLEPEEAELYVEVGEVYYERGDVLDASYAGERALELEPGLHRAHALLARANLELGHPVSALAHALDATNTPHPDQLALWTLADVFLELGRYQDAGRVYRSVLAVGNYPSEVDRDVPGALSRSDSGYVWFGIGLALRGEGRSAEALASYDSALVRIPWEARVHLQKGMLLERRGECMIALACYREAIRHDPLLIEAQIREGVVLFHSGNLMAARDLLLSIAYDYAPGGEVLFTLGSIAERRGFLLEALDYYAEARQSDESLAEAWLHEGLVLGRLGMKKEAEESLFRAAQEGSSAARWILGKKPDTANVGRD